MTTRRGPDFRLVDALSDPGFTPRRRDVPALLELLLEPTHAPGSGARAPQPSEDRDARRERTAVIERALARVAEPAAREALSLGASAEPRRRARLTALLGRLRKGTPLPADLDAAVLERLLGALTDADPTTRRRAALALARSGPAEPRIAQALLDALAAECAADVRRALVSALGRAGGEAARAVLELTAPVAARAPAEVAGHDRALHERALLHLTRTEARRAVARFAAERIAPAPLPVAMRCREGLEKLLAAEVSENDPELGPRAAHRRVEITLAGAPSRLFRARLMLDFAYALAPESYVEEAELPLAIARALTSRAAWRIFDHFTDRADGPVRFRLAFAGGGKRRALVYSVAEAVRQRRPTLLNDPTESPWEALVHERTAGTERSVTVELAPRIDDPRFAYRRGDVPAASHPTIAAALVRAAGPRAEDVVWDPFVGSGLELCERAIAGPYRRLIGSDRSAPALAVARANLDAAGATEAELHVGDASELDPSPSGPVSLVITNPPMGRRVLRGADLGELYDRFLANAARRLARDGRIAWVSPLPARGLAAAAKAGLVPSMRQEIDMGGFRAELQVLRLQKPR